MSLTETQRKAVAARGNVLVVAGAGTGKTHTLVERCLNCLLVERPKVSLDEILMVTFTEAAAAEMRQRIRARLEEELSAHPTGTHWQEQLTIFETAHIGTLHSFCLKLVREHFYQLELDPQLTVLAEEEARLVADETLDDLLQKHYAGRGPQAIAVQQLIQSQGRGWDKPIRALILRLHHYTQTLPNPGCWLRSQLDMFGEAEPVIWTQWLVEAGADWSKRWQPALKRIAAGNELAAQCAALLEAFDSWNSRPAAATLLENLTATDQRCPHGKKTEWLKPLGRFLDEARFLSSLFHSQGTLDPLTEDWTWVRDPMRTLVSLTQDFTLNFSEAKRELGVVDFHDLEQHVLRLLWDPTADQPTAIARQWRKKLRFVFVDEYQDINAAQDKIIQTLSGEGDQANRFLVGDVKQSIYRFRLANPRIFQNYVQTWNKPPGTAIPLVENFRSREGLLEFVNSLFTATMRPEAGGVPYGEDSRLVFGSPATRGPLTAKADPAPCVELHLRKKSQNGDRDASDPGENGLAEVRDLEEADKEARLVALRLREIHTDKRLVWDEETRQFRSAEWRDIAILLRSPAGKIDSYAKEFARLGVPLQVARGGFYQSLEISDLVSLLQVLDNPLQDVPALAVLHSPLVGLTANELATIRLTVLKAHFWTALVRWNEAREHFGKQLRASQSEPGSASTNRATSAAEPDQTHQKVATFLGRFARWRRLARQVSLSRCLEAVLSETHYADWLLTQDRGEQRHANVQRLVSLAQQFDQFQRQGLFRFLRFIEAQQLAQAEPQVAAVTGQNAVRLMSIHQSKGLEFPVVVVADLGKAFNLSDLSADIILDETYGLCPQVKPPHTGQRYPSLPYWLARDHQLRELLGEEMRLLYVALTRARDRLILSGSVSAKKFETVWKAAEKAGGLDALVAARSYLDWVGLWAAQNCPGLDAEAEEGANRWIRWSIYDDARLAAAEPSPLAAEPLDGLAPAGFSPDAWKRLEDKLSWVYPFTASIVQPAKVSVSQLRRRAAELDDSARELRLTPDGTRGPEWGSKIENGKRTGVKGLKAASAAEFGTAHHAFLQVFSLDQAHSRAALESEATRLRNESVLKEDDFKLLDFEALAAFWASDLGCKIRAQAGFVHRELPFTARFTPQELAALTGESIVPGLEREFVAVQGVADLAVLLPQEIWLIDFKTDAVKAGELGHKAKLYSPQLQVYAQALTRIYRRPVSECWLCFLSPHKQVAVKL